MIAGEKARRWAIAVLAALPLAEAAKAQQRSKQGGTPGKIVLRVD